MNSLLIRKEMIDNQCIINKNRLITCYYVLISDDSNGFYEIFPTKLTP